MLESFRAWLDQIKPVWISIYISDRYLSFVVQRLAATVIL